MCYVNLKPNYKLIKHSRLTLYIRRWYPGESEHQTGLAIDVTNTSRCFDKTSIEAQWLANNAYKYGFILRYPENKEDVTGYSYEPWHIRYVGKDLAEKIYMNSETLEEYLKHDN